jgi:hypothetical protein
MTTNSAHDRSIQAVMILADTPQMHRNAAPVVAAEILIRRGLTDQVILAHLARHWPLDEHELQAALDAAHILVRREHGTGQAESA